MNAVHLWLLQLIDTVSNFLIADGSSMNAEMWSTYAAQKTLLSISLASSYIRSQNRVLLLFIIISCLLLLIVLCNIVFCIGRFVFGKFGAQRYQAHPTKRGRFYLLLLLFFVSWFIILSFTALTVYGAVDFYTYVPKTNNYYSSYNAKINADVVKLLNEPAFLSENITADRNESRWDEAQALQAFSGNSSVDSNQVWITVKSHISNDSTNDGLGEKDQQLLLPLKYRNLHNQTTYAFAIAILIFIPLPLLIFIILSAITTIIGTLCYCKSYHPIDRSVLSNRMGILTIQLSMFLLVFSPLIILFSNVMLIYAQMYADLCPQIQKKILINDLYESSSLNDVKHDGYLATVQNIGDQLLSAGDQQRLFEAECWRGSRSISVIWICCLVIGVTSTICTILLLKISKYFLRMNTEYYWNSSENYSTLSSVRPNSSNKHTTVCSAF